MFEYSDLNSFSFLAKSAETDLLVIRACGASWLSPLVLLTSEDCSETVSFVAGASISCGSSSVVDELPTSFVAGGGSIARRGSACCNCSWRCRDCG